MAMRLSSERRRARAAREQQRWRQGGARARDQVRLAETENRAKKKLVSHNNRDFNVTRA